MAECISGWESQIWVEPGASTHTFDASSEHYEFLTESLGKRETRTSSDGNRNTRSRYLERNRLTRREIGGTIEFPLYVQLLDMWLTRILGGTESSDVWTTANTLASFGVLVKRFDDYFTYTDCKVNKAIFKGSSGGNVSLSLDIMGLTESQSTSQPAGVPSTYGGTTIAYETIRFSDSLLSVDSTFYKMEDFELTIDNMLVPRYANSLNPVCLVASDREVTLRATLAGITDVPLHALGTSGLAGALYFTNGSVDTEIVMPKLVWPQDTPTTTGKGLLDHPVTFTALASGTTPEITINNDATV